MRYVTEYGFEEYASGDPVFAEMISRGVNIARTLERAESRMLGYIIPNEPEDCDQIEAFRKAVYEQVLYENGESGRQLSDMPAGVTSFTVNGFSAAISGTRNAMFRAGISPDAMAYLLEAGLLCKAVDCRC